MKPTAEALKPEYSERRAENNRMVSENALIDGALQTLKHDPGAVFEKEALQAIQIVAAENPADFARIRKSVKDSGQVSMTQFDRLISPSSDTEDMQVPFADVQHWPEQVCGTELLNAIEEKIAQFIIADRQTIQAAALWVVFTWFHDETQLSPLAHISAPEKRCGKSVLLACMSRLVCKPVPVSHISSAALFRSIEKWQPCLLIDEADSFMKYNEDLRGILNSGFNRDGAFVIRCCGDNHEPRRFSTFSPKVICGIGSLPSTLVDRAIPLRLRRKMINESSKPLRHSRQEEWKELQSKLSRWAADNQFRMGMIRPKEISGLNDRAQDAWEPLQQVAALAGGNWPEKAGLAALHLHGFDEDKPSLGAELLEGVRLAFGESEETRIFTTDLLSLLLSDPEAPWATYSRGKPMTARQLAKLLREFGISSNTVRKGIITKKGYRLEQFQDAFQRYLPQQHQ